MGMDLHAFAECLQLSRRGARAKRHRPDIVRLGLWALLAQESRGVVVGQEHIECLGGEAPVVGRVAMQMQVERHGEDKDAIGPQDTPNLVEAPPEMFHMFKGREGQDSANRGIGQIQRLDVADQVHTGARSHIQADVVASRKERAQIADGLLAGDLVGADLEDGTREGKRLGHCPSDPVKKAIHGNPRKDRQRGTTRAKRESSREQERGRSRREKKRTRFGIASERASDKMTGRDR